MPIGFGEDREEAVWDAVWVGFFRRDCAYERRNGAKRPAEIFRDSHRQD